MTKRRPHPNFHKEPPPNLHKEPPPNLPEGRPSSGAGVLVVCWQNFEKLAKPANCASKSSVDSRVIPLAGTKPHTRFSVDKLMRL